jgi:BON domain
MKRITALLIVALATGALAGCGYSSDRAVTNTQYVPPQTTVTTTTSTAYMSPANTNSRVVTTVTRNADGSVTRTTSYYPTRAYTYYSTDDGTLASEVRSTIRQDPLVNAHAQNIAVGSDAGVVEITGRADSVSAVDQASRDALEVPGVIRVNNDMVINPMSPG